MKKLFTRFTAIITTIAVAAVSLCTTAFATNENQIIGSGLVSYNEWKSSGYAADVLNNLYKSNKVNSVVSNIKSEWTDIQKAAYIYSYIHNNYNFALDGSVMYSIQSGKAICETYAVIFSSMAQSANIPVTKASIDSGIGHSVNLVKYNDMWYHIDCQGDFFADAWNTGYYDLESNISPNSIATASEYKNNRTSAYFEYNGQWYAYGASVYKIPSSLKNEYNSTWNEVFSLRYNANLENVSFKEKSNISKTGDAASPNSYAYDNNGKLYYDHGNAIYVYNAANNSTSFIAATNNKVVWLGVDKYALYYVTRDGKFGTASLTSNNTALETTKPSLTMRAGEAAYNTAVASTEYLCGYQLSYKSSNENVATVDKYGMVYAKKAGTAYITVSYMGRSSDYKVTVKDMNYSGTVDSVPYVVYYYVKSDSTGNHQIKEIVNAYDPRLTGGTNNSGSNGGNTNTGSSSSSSKTDTSAAVSTINGSIYKVANDNLYLQVGVPFDLKYIANINENTKVTSSNNKFVAVTKTDTGYTITAKSNTAYITITNGNSSYRFRVVAYKDSFIPTTFKLSYSSTVVPSKLKVGKTFTLKSISDENASNKISWVISNDNIEITSEVPIWSNSSLTFKAVKKGTTTIYCISSTGIVKSYKVTIK